MKRIVTIALALFIVWDLYHSYTQYSYMTLDGDLADNVVPAKAYAPVLHDPFGWNALTKGERAAGVNRFFAHGSEYVYMRAAPRALRTLTDPVSSVYVSAALFRLFVHILLLYLLSIYVTGSADPRKQNFLAAFAFMSPLLQVNYYAIYMGVVDHSITYTFFYAFPLCLTLLFFLPLYQKQKLSASKSIGLILLSLILAFNGPLVPPVILVVSTIVVVPYFYRLMKRKQAEIPRAGLVVILVACLLSLYSLYIGTFNSDSYAHTASLAERYSKLPEGLFNILTQKLGYPLLLLLVIINVVIIKVRNDEGREQVMKMLRYIGIFALLYILLLPFGGYREYRPNILRYDTIMPITIALIFFYARSSFFLVGSMKALPQKLYIGVLVLFSTVFTIADIDIEKDNLCELEKIAQIASSPLDTVRLDTTCPVLSWGIIRDPKYSDVNGEMLRVWRITDRKKLYYQK